VWAPGPINNWSADWIHSVTQGKEGFVIDSETTQPEGPGVMSYGVIATRERHGAFRPALSD